MSANAVWMRWLIELGWDAAPVERVMDAVIQASFEEAREIHWWNLYQGVRA